MWQPNEMSTTVELLVRGGDVVTMDAAGTVVRDGAVAVGGAQIVAVGRFADLRPTYPAARVIGAAESVVTPLRVAAGVRAVGMRATLGQWGCDIADAPFAAPAAEVLVRQRAGLAALPPGGLVEGWVTLVGTI